MGSWMFFCHFPSFYLRSLPFCRQYKWYFLSCDIQNSIFHCLQLGLIRTAKHIHTKEGNCRMSNEKDCSKAHLIPGFVLENTSMLCILWYNCLLCFINKYFHSSPSKMCCDKVRSLSSSTLRSNFTFPTKQSCITPADSVTNFPIHVVCLLGTSSHSKEFGTFSKPFHFAWKGAVLQPTTPDRHAHFQSSTLLPVATLSSTCHRSASAVSNFGILLL